MNLQALSYKLRQDVIDIITAGKSGHIGGDMSVMDVLVTLYYDVMDVTPENFASNKHDHFIMSKGHSVESLYAVLASKGFFPLEQVLKEFSRFNTKFIGHPNNKLPGIEMNSGSLGHGLPVAVGMALACRMNNDPHRVYTVMGDGELAEGSNWEGAMAGANYKLDNLCAVVDRNRLQISGSTEDVMALDELSAKWAAFGWNVINVQDGNDIAQLKDAFAKAAAHKGSPSVLISNTIKGKGSPVMENKASWHHHVPSPEEYQSIMSDLKAAYEEALKNG